MLTIAQIHNGIAKEIDRQEELVDEMANCEQKPGRKSPLTR